MGGIKGGPHVRVRPRAAHQPPLRPPLFRTVRQPIHFINCHQFPAASTAPSALSAPPALLPPSIFFWHPHPPRYHGGNWDRWEPGRGG
ncbi:hypothetical protein CLOM_g6337 [Closterium sp. NIES-68]|nr:hypothetical protein CLOM_g6337 [Closterium sp. NIES-68]